MNTKRIVITGGPGSGKTSLINELESKGFACLPEISREVIKKAQAEGIDQLFLEQPLLFSQRLLEGRLKQFQEAQNYKEPRLFYDRGMPDVVAYMDYINTDYPKEFEKTCQDHRYDVVFLLPPWEAIYQQDNERYESYEQAEKIFQYLDRAYQRYGYEVHHVPFGTLPYRSEFILKKLSQLL